MWGGRWFQVAWSDLAGASIAVKELLPIIVAAAIWGHMWRGKIVLSDCDNQGVVSAACGSYCKDSSMAQMLQCLSFFDAKFDVTLSAAHVPGVENGPADSLSRNKFFDLVPQT